MNQLTDLELMFKRLRNESAKDKKLIRDKKYLRDVSNHNCSWCGMTYSSDSHHLFGSYGSLKTSDYTTIPLCRDCHTRVENDENMKHECVKYLIPMMAKMLWYKQDYEFLEHLIIETHNYLKDKNK